jgi:starch synthase
MCAAPKAPLTILMIASETAPFSKTGGLADVSAGLSRALAREGHHVTVITPRYRGVTGGEPRHLVRGFVGGNAFEATLLETPLGDGARALLVDCPPLYDRAGLYDESNIEYADNPLRFAFLSIAALDWAAAQATPPSVVHLHDWQTGLTPVFAQQYLPQMRLPFVFTIHNLAYQGVFPKAWVPTLGLRWEDFTVAGFEFYDQLSFLKAGINRSDALTTVSPTYAKEIQSREAGHGLDGVIRKRQRMLTAVLNGIDVNEWDPSNDAHLPAPYTADDVTGKAQAKHALLEAFGLPSNEAALQRPVIGMVSRLVQQKGMDLIEAVAPQLPGLDASLTVVGMGHPRYELMWRSLAASYPDRIAAFIGFDEHRAHLVDGGADMFLMPSQYEPCGLNQMYSLRYGTVPIVRAVGGLVDTVRPYNARNGRGTGFLFRDYDPAAMMAAIRAALDTYRRPRAWRRLQANGMRQDFSWDRSAAEYVKVYKGVMAARRNTRPRAPASKT